ncbi:hypothetical protein [Planotetraspora mira]|uniref:hypothetical protein n=1 Tax=Planotetraspora mira TaxID=58121 RepID=UPI001951218E|nr:hypothetical protein [Planotetraspora mira]
MTAIVSLGYGLNFVSEDLEKVAVAGDEERSSLRVADHNNWFPSTLWTDRSVSAVWPSVRAP